VQNHCENISVCDLALLPSVAQVYVWILADGDHLLHVHIGADLHIPV
jgi:hypothetical protein